MNAPAAPSEEARLQALGQYRILDTPLEADFDDLVKLAAEICQTPISLVSLVDRDRQWFKGRYGLDIAETPRRLSFCSHAIQKPQETMVVPDAAKDPRFADNELVTAGPKMRFYAGVPLGTPEGHALGTLCVIDRKPRNLSPSQKEALQILSRQVLTQLELRRRLAEVGRMAAVLQENNKELEGFSHAVSHDLRAPLRASVGYSEVLLRQLTGKAEDDTMHLLRQILQSGKRADQMLDDFTKLLRLRQQSLRVVPLDMPELVQGVVDELHSLSPSARVHIGPLPPAIADRGLLRQVWVNLLSNALKFSRGQASPTIDIAAREEPERTVYSVKDNGPGFDMRQADNLWTPFHRLHGHQFEGTGLGLSIVQRIIHRHGGAVWAEAKPGQGATFYFALPKADRTAAFPENYAASA